MSISKHYKSASKIELADAYGVTLHTFCRWINPIDNVIGKYIARRYTPKQVEKIVELLGEPQKIKVVRE